MSTCADVGSFIESKTSVVQTSNVGFTSEVSDYLVVHTGPAMYQQVVGLPSSSRLPVNRNVNDEECVRLVSVLKGQYTCL